MAERFHTITAPGVSLTLDLAVGHVRAFEIEAGGRKLAPLHTAPWVNDRSITDDPEIPPNLKYLSGDFFCAPFAASDVETAPPHGWPANAPWEVLDEESRGDRATARYVLTKPVMGARVTKEITLRGGHPFAYQRHTFEGGRGAVSAASHAMTRFSGKGRLSFSKKAYADIPALAQETDPKRGRSLFKCPARFTDLAKLPLADGSFVDLRDYPLADGHEDFLMLVEEKGATLGWAAALRPGESDIVLSLKNPADYPVTFLWFSNAGRYYAPWNGRHKGVLGIEEGRAWSAYGHKASIEENELSRSGIPTSVTLGGTVSLSHVVGGIPLPAGWREVATVQAGDGVLRLTGDDGTAVEYPYDPGFVRIGSSQP
ncbi:MAG TPA: hypothetical protein VFK86_05465 [Bauldia sp.]|nr:hypothetical protein [Bauldia sp.]